MDTKASIILSWMFSTIFKIKLFWLFTVIMFAASVSLIYFRPNFAINDLMQTDICASVSHNI